MWFGVKKLDIVEILVLISMLVCVVHSSTESCIERAVAIKNPISVTKVNFNFME